MATFKCEDNVLNSSDLLIPATSPRPQDIQEDLTLFLSNYWKISNWKLSFRIQNRSVLVIQC